MRGLPRSDADTVRTVLVTGGAGFIGSHVCEALLHHGVRVRVLDDFSSGRKENLAHLTDKLEAKLEICEGSIESPVAVARALEGVSGIAIILPNGESQLALEKQLATLAAEAGVAHIVKVSSVESSAM